MASNDKLEIEVHHTEDDAVDEIQEETDEDNPGRRTRKLTSKGVEYTLDIKRKRLEQLCKGLERGMDQLMDIVSTQGEEAQLQKSYKRWVSIYDEFLTLDLEYRKLLDTDEISDYEEKWFTSRNTAFLEFKESAVKWFIAQQKDSEPLMNIKEEDQTSVISRTSTRSRKSTSSGSSVTSARIIQEQKRVELEIKAASLKKKRQIKEEKLRLQMKEEELKLQEEVEINEAQGKILDEFDVQSTHSQRLHIKKSVSKPKAPSEHSCDGSTGLMAIVRHLNKPETTVDKFSGNPLQFQRFIRQFETRILANCDTFEEKLNYLEQYTTGEPNKIVVGYSYLDAKKGYRAAMQELQERYGDSDVIVTAFIKKALNWSLIKPDNPKALDEFAIFLAECERAVEDLEAMKILEYSENFKKIVSKLPYNLHDKWRSIVHEKKESGKRLTFSHLVKFVRKEAKKINDPSFGREALSSDQKVQAKNPKGQTFSKPSQKTHASLAADVTGVKPPSAATASPKPSISPSSEPKQSGEAASKQNAFTAPCQNCKGRHALAECRKLASLPFYDRLDVLKSKGYCYGCLQYGHTRQFCKTKATCTHCQGRHPSVLHVDGRIPPRAVVTDSSQQQPEKKSEEKEEKEQPQKTSNVGNMDKNNTRNAPECTMAIIPVRVRLAHSSRALDTYAFLDPGSNVTFCTEKLKCQLGAEGRRMKLTMDTMGVPHVMHTYEIGDIEIMDLDQKNVIPLPTIYTKDRMPVSKKHIPTAEDIQTWPHLLDISLPQIDADIGLLIGNNVPDACTPLEVRAGPRGTPHAARSLLGWIPWNVFRERKNVVNTVNIADITAIEQIQELKELNERYIKSTNQDVPENISEDKREDSIEDKRFLEKMKQSQRCDDGHFEYCLPFRENDPILPDNHFIAKQRLSSLKRKLQTNPKFLEDYKTFMKTMLDQGFAEIVPEEEISRSDSKVWYLPHHGIYHPAKPQKIRVVFDCSSKYQGKSLNDLLLQGPDLTNSLLGVLLRFRLEPIAVIGDIEKMFYQVQVRKEDRDCLRFYWWPDGDLGTEPAVFRMTVHIFGAASSPSCSSYALRQTIQENQKKFPPSIGSAAMSNFYVDDFLCSVPTEDEAIQLVIGITEICQLGGFRVTKWITNSRKVLEAIPENERATSVTSLDFDELPTERALGVKWNLESDDLTFNIKLQELKATRRNILSVIGSVYDPHGLVSPFVLPARILLQDLCKEDTGWDDDLSTEQVERWNEWTENLMKLKNVSVSRCMKPEEFQVAATELHHFADASDIGYGVVSFIRLISLKGQIHVSLLFAKSKVAPMKKITIPRMELTAATLAVKLNKMLTYELQLKVDKTLFWTDSMAVIRYVRNQSTRFHTFVANRLAIIHEGTDASQWRHVDGRNNPADLASRGSKVQESKVAEWFSGPGFLHEDEVKWPSDPEQLKSENLSTDDPEVKSNAALEQKNQEPQLLDDLIARFSDLTKLKRVVGWVLWYVRCLKKKANDRQKIQDAPIASRTRNRASKQGEAKKPRDSEMILPLERIQEAEVILIKNEQKKTFNEELESLSTDENCSVKKSSPLYRLDPFVQEGIIRVGGRLQSSKVPYDAKHQILLPQDSLYSKLLLRDIHKETGHQGKNAMLAELRQKYWIPRAGQLIKRITSTCVFCRRYTARTEQQKMADLPEDRVAANKPPFTHAGMDYFGPFEVKRGRTVQKRYGVIFTCCSSRAVHLEVAHSLTTDSCVNSIRRFLARRGLVESIRSDNGTNIVGAERELRESIQQWNQSKIASKLHQLNIRWEFNPPSGSHFGGFWERLIRSVRKILCSILKEQPIYLDDEGLCTLMCEVEYTLNSRPVTAASEDPNEQEMLTPNHLLLMKGNTSPPPGTFGSEDHYVRSRWRQIQYLTNVFWSRWIREYLPLLQRRQKWQRVRRNLRVGDIVLVAENTPRNVWPLARITEVFLDRKGLVRVVTVKTKTSKLQRPVDKLCLILEADK